MKVELSPETEAYIDGSVRAGAFASASEFVEAAARRQMQEEAWFEQKVLEGLAGPVTPLTPGDLKSVRDVAERLRADGLRVRLDDWELALHTANAREVVKGVA